VLPDRAQCRAQCVDHFADRPPSYVGHLHPGVMLGQMVLVNHHLGGNFPWQRDGRSLWIGRSRCLKHCQAGSHCWRWIVRYRADRFSYGVRWMVLIVSGRHNRRVRLQEVVYLRGRNVVVQCRMQVGRCVQGLSCRLSCCGQYGRSWVVG